MKNKLFDNFQSVSAKQWKQKIQVDLKGADYNKTLLTTTNEGIHIEPFYHQDNFKKLPIKEANKEFEICQTIFVGEEVKANFLAKNALERGAESIRFKINKVFNIHVLGKDLFTHEQYKNTKFYFNFSFYDIEFVKSLYDVCKNRAVFFYIDIIGNLAKTGNWFDNHKADHDNLLKYLKCGGALNIQANLYQNAGANMVQQVAYALSHANTYLNFINNLTSSNKELALQSIVNKIQFQFSVGGNYFFEIAKLRAFRYLWQILLKEYHVKSEVNIFAEPSMRNKSIYDYNVNMLRTTTECMSAILGGATTISNVAYDTIYHKKNEFGERIARNQLIILKEESNFKNGAFASGSYYIEELTYQIADKALQIFKDMEAGGGFVKQLFAGKIQYKIKESANKEQAQFDADDLVLLGVNLQANSEDKMKQNLELNPFIDKRGVETVIVPILPVRLAEKQERKRLAKEK